MTEEYVTPTVELIVIDDVITTSDWGEDELPGDSSDDW